MAQFASTLYPQTNPSSQMLLTFRERVNRGQFSVADEAQWWLAFGPPALDERWRRHVEPHSQSSNPSGIAHRLIPVI